MPKSSKRFVLSTSQLNSHKFRCLTDGADLADFIANPIMYWLHMTPEGTSKDELLPIGFWEDIKVEGDEITAVPNFDDNDEFAMKIYNKVEHGTIRAASVEADPIELDTNKANWLPGQKLPTLKRWRIGEASIVDRGSNKGAIAKLKHEGKVLVLSDQGSADEFFNSLQIAQKQDMSKIKLNKKAAGVLKLAEGTEVDATEIIDQLVEKHEEQAGEIVTLRTAKEKAEGEVTTLKETVETAKNETLVDEAIRLRKIPAGEKEFFLKAAKHDYEGTKKLLDAKAANPDIINTLQKETDTDDAEVKKLKEKTWDELDQSNQLARLKEVSIETFKLKFKAKFGREYGK